MKITFGRGAFYLYKANRKAWRLRMNGHGYRSYAYGTVKRYWPLIVTNCVIQRKHWKRIQHKFTYSYQDGELINFKGRLR